MRFSDRMHRIWIAPLCDPMARLLLLAINQYVSAETNYSFPSQALLCRITGMSERTIRNKTRILVELGYLRVGHRKNTETGSQQSNIYHICFEALGTEEDPPAPHAAPPERDAAPPGTSCPPPRQEMPSPPAPVADDQSKRSVKEISQDQTLVQLCAERASEPKILGKKDKDELLREFDEFWDEYPRIEGKAKARRLFAILRNKGSTADSILLKLKSCKRLQWIDTDKRFIPMAANWLEREDFSEIDLPNQPSRPVKADPPTDFPIMPIEPFVKPDKQAVNSALRLGLQQAAAGHLADQVRLKS